MTQNNPKRPKPDPKLRAIVVRERSGRVMLGVAAVGVAVSLVAVVVGWVLLGQIEQTGTESLEVSIQTVDSIESTVDIADEVLTSTTRTLAAVEDALNTVADSFSTTGAVVEDVVLVADTVEPALTDATATLEELAGIGRTVDSVLEGLSGIPFAPSYDPQAGLGDTVQELADEIGPIASTIGDLGDSVDESKARLDQLELDVRRLADQAGDVNADLRGSDDLLAGYRENLREARRVAVEARSGVDRNLWWAKLLLVIGGLNFAVGQIVPLRMGTEQLKMARAEREAARAEGETLRAP